MRTRAPVAAAARPGVMARAWTWLKTFEAALETTHDDLQDARILALEREVARLRARADAPPP